MEELTLDKVSYPLLSQVSPTELEALVRREGEFDALFTERQKATLHHLQTQQVHYLRVEDAPFTGLYLYGTAKQLTTYLTAN